MSKERKQWWIVIPNWEKFQHYQKDAGVRNPVWIKLYTELINDDAYLELPIGTRGVLHGIWMSYAACRGQLLCSTLSLSRRLRTKVSTVQLKSLNDAGFIQIVDSKPLAFVYKESRGTRALARGDKKREGLKPDLSSAKPTTTRAAAALPLEGSRSAPASPSDQESEHMLEPDPQGLARIAETMRAAVANGADPTKEQEHIEEMNGVEAQRRRKASREALAKIRQEDAA